MVYYHLVDNKDAFIERLMNENLWSYEYTIRVIREYRRFIFLTSLDYVSPSFEIDQVWHTHMLFSKDYSKMCQERGKFLHHDPIDKKIKNRVDPYPFTKKLYKRTFSQEPPADIWTDWKPSHYCYVNSLNDYIIPRGDIKMLWGTLITAIKHKLYENF